MLYLICAALALVVAFGGGGAVIRKGTRKRR